MHKVLIILDIKYIISLDSQPAGCYLTMSPRTALQEIVTIRRGEKRSLLATELLMLHSHCYHGENITTKPYLGRDAASQDLAQILGEDERDVALDDV